MTAPLSEVSERFAAARKYGDADGYDSYMGGWSAALASLFLLFASVGQATSILDVGCGTGNLLAAAAVAFPDAALTGLDPSKTLLAKARERRELTSFQFVEGTVEQLPFDRGAFDSTLSMLVLQEFADRSLALREMRRVTRRGGIVAGCQWDFSRMPIIDSLVKTLGAINMDSAEQLSALMPGFANEAELLQYWAKAGFSDVSVGRVEVARPFRNFDELWSPLLRGSTPSTLALSALPKNEQQAVRGRMRVQLANNSDDTRLRISAEAIVVRGCA